MWEPCRSMQTNGWADGLVEASSWFSQFCERAERGKRLHKKCILRLWDLTNTIVYRLIFILC